MPSFNNLVLGLLAAAGVNAIGLDTTSNLATEAQENDFYRNYGTDNEVRESSHYRQIRDSINNE